MNAKILIEEITNACGGDLNRQVLVSTTQSIDIGGPDTFEWETFEFKTNEPVVFSKQPGQVCIQIP